MRQKVLVEGDENLLEKHELLVQESDDFKYIIKERNEDGSVDTYAVVPIEDYISTLEEAYTEGQNKAEQ